VLHETVIVVVAYFVLAWPVGAGAQYCVIALISLAATLLLYDLGVRRSPLTRFLFGLKQPGGPAARTADQVDDSDAPPSRRLAPSERDEQEPTLTKGARS
jgi:glucans biosynthesis protein C